MKPGTAHEPATHIFLFERFPNVPKSLFTVTVKVNVIQNGVLIDRFTQTRTCKRVRKVTEVKRHDVVPSKADDI